jgi:hypothetical protein
MRGATEKTAEANDGVTDIGHHTMKNGSIVDTVTSIMVQ